MNRKLVYSLLVVLLVASISVSLVNAGGWSFDWGLGSLWADGYVAGLGSGDVNVTLTAHGMVQAMCENNGGNQAPGRNPVYFEVTQTAVFSTDENGRADVFVEAPNPTVADVEPSPSPKDAGCPSDSWTVVGLRVEAIDWTDAHIVVTDAATGQVVKHDLTFTCDTYYNADGIAVDVDCWHTP
jgi:hypothetical protein